MAYWPQWRGRSSVKARLSGAGAACARHGLAALCLTTIGLLWWLLHRAREAASISDADAAITSLVLLIATYCLSWGIYLAECRERLFIKVARFKIATTTILLCLLLLELAVVITPIDFRLVLPLSKRAQSELEPWRSPYHRPDRELLHLHRPHLIARGETPGELVQPYGIPTNQRYRYEVRYDSQGFRNSHEIQEAPIVVIGDSFVEAGLVPEPSILTSRLRQLLQVEVANLGQAWYGPQQELVVLRRYALKLQPKLVVWLFFEGNDLADVSRYERVRSLWDVVLADRQSFRQRSFTKNALELLAELSRSGPDQPDGEAHRRSCGFMRSQTEAGKTLYFGNPGELSPEDLQAVATVQDIVLQASALAAESGAEFLFVYVPTTFRVYRDFCEFPADGYGQVWKPSNLPSQLQTWFRARQIPYLDLTAPLTAAASRGELVYFPDDSHWNEHGNALAAEVIADLIREKGWR